MSLRHVHSSTTEVPGLHWQYGLLKRQILLQPIANPFVAGELHCSGAFLLTVEEIQFSVVLCGCFVMR